MKKILLLSALMLSLAGLSAQSLEFVYQGKALENNAKITVTEFIVDEDFGDEMDFDADIRNKTDRKVILVVGKEELEIPKGSSNDFCNMINCYASELSAEYELEANATDDQFHGTFRPVEKSIARIKYFARVKGLMPDEAAVEVTFSYVPSGIDKVGLNSLSLLQGDGRIELRYNATEELNLRIVSITGACVGTHRLAKNSNSLKLDNTISRGIYLLVFNSASGMQHTEKILVK